MATLPASYGGTFNGQGVAEMWGCDGGGSQQLGGYPQGDPNQSGAWGQGAPNGCGAGQSAPPPSGNFNEQEVEYYQTVWEIVDPNKSGYVDGATAANILGTSGLPQDVLHQIWNIADMHGQGALNMERFFVALRLVAHAQTGMQPMPQLEGQMPQMLPELDLKRQRAPSETSQGNHSVHGSQGSEMAPVITSQLEQEATSAARKARSRSPSAARMGPFRQERWAPSQREKRKYASLFKRTDWNGDGFVEAAEASALLERSGLDQQTLALCWEHSDRDRDGKLTFLEFVCLVHMVTSALRGAKLPSNQEPLPQELVDALGRMEPVEVLVAERERSRSRSASPSPAATAATATAAMPSMLVMPDLGAFGEDPFGASGAFGDLSPAASSKNKKEEPFPDPFGLGDATAVESTAPSAWGMPDSPSGIDGIITAQEDSHFTEVFNTNLDEGAHHDIHVDVHHLGDVKSQFEAVKSADQQVSGLLRQEVDVLNTEMKEVQASIQEEIQHQKALQQEIDQQESADKRPSLNAQLLETKSRLAALREERNQLSIEGRALRQDHLQVAEEYEFLRRLVEEDQATLDVLLRSCQHLERSWRTLEAHGDELHQKARATSEELKREKDMRNEEKELLQRLQREIEAATGKPPPPSKALQMIEDKERAAIGGRRNRPARPSLAEALGTNSRGGAFGGPTTSTALGGSLADLDFAGGFGASDATTAVDALAYGLSPTAKEKKSKKSSKSKADPFDLGGDSPLPDFGGGFGSESPPSSPKKSKEKKSKRNKPPPVDVDWGF